MKYSRDTVPLPALVGLEDGIKRVVAVRPLTSADKTDLGIARTVYAVVSPLMQMFQLMNENYKELNKFLVYLKKDYPSTAPFIANRLIFNYVAAVDAFLDHFDRSYKRQCRSKKIQATGFDEFRRQLEKKDDDFGFFSEFRNFVMHACLPVGNLSYSKSLESGVAYSITYCSSELLTDQRGKFHNCRLLKKQDSIDLILTLSRVNALMNGCVFQKIVGCFIKDLKVSQSIHSHLADEVQKYGKQLKPAIMIERTNDKGNFNWKFDTLPIDLISELGIAIKEKPSP